MFNSKTASTQQVQSMACSLLLLLLLTWHISLLLLLLLLTWRISLLLLLLLLTWHISCGLQSPARWWAWSTR
jgi:hypothetical protein